MKCRTTWAIWWCCARPAATATWPLVKVSLAGAVTALGGVTGYFWSSSCTTLFRLPYFLTVASNSFVYVALADLIQQLQSACQRGKPRRRSSGCWSASAWSRWSAAWPRNTRRRGRQRVEVADHAPAAVGLARRVVTISSVSGLLPNRLANTTVQA